MDQKTRQLLISSLEYEIRSIEDSKMQIEISLQYKKTELKKLRKTKAEKWV